MGSKLYRTYPNQKWRRKEERKKNYEKGRFGNRNNGRNFSWKEKILVMIHIVPDRWLAKLFGSSVNGIQALRWRTKKNYLGMYGS